jgi:hypothetical protein
VAAEELSRSAGGAERASVARRECKLLGTVLDRPVCASDLGVTSRSSMAAGGKWCRPWCGGVLVSSGLTWGGDEVLCESDGTEDMEPTLDLQEQGVGCTNEGRTGPAVE